MVLSNILDIINPPPLKPHDQQTPSSGGGTSSSSDNNTNKDKQDEPCLTCLATSSAVMIFGGAYLSSGLVFATNDNKPLPGVTPQWRSIVRGGGAFLIGLGVYRGISAVSLAISQYNKSKESDITNSP
ncbi:uncharacterized protein SAPINGB_P004590 [Magnusiomyces paraingens]|uniref:DUF4536 domain-containing protein n=1 Tax=Magnusiomyces paraingens TaxID=2606893 RepID=A0A5E8C2Q5_9ASCO|nr:uncharacterized protein SAPINGB_P004590 [Saprochaete ingens]VVT55425.1 unnamed protein product [Saprochaete ingens]